MSILAKIRQAGGDVVRQEWRFRLTPGRLTSKSVAWLKLAGRWRAACLEAWPLLDLWEERAAILEYDAELPRADAERIAYREVMACST